MFEDYFHRCPRCKSKRKVRFLKKEGGKYYCKSCGHCQHHYEQTLEGTLQRWSDRAIVNIEKLRKYEPEKFNNERIFKVFWECYYNAMIGEYHVSLIMQGVLMETAINEVIFINENRYQKGEFGKKLQRAYDSRYITEPDYKILKKVKNQLRNNYLHADISEITGNLKIPMFWVEKKPEGVDSVTYFYNAVETINEGKAPRTTIEGGKSGQASIYIQNYVDEKICIPLLNDAYDFLVDFCGRHFSEESYKEFEKKFGPLVPWTMPITATDEE